MTSASRPCSEYSLNLLEILKASFWSTSVAESAESAWANIVAIMCLI